MPGRLSKSVDYIWTGAGDYALDSDTGDLQDTKLIRFRDTLQRADTRIRSSSSDWRIVDMPSANLSRFLGKPNTPELGAEVYSSIYAALTSGGFLRPAELDIEVFPLSLSSIGVVVFIIPIGEQTRLFLSYTYDVRDNRIVPRNL